MMQNGSFQPHRKKIHYFVQFTEYNSIHFAITLNWK